MTLKRILKTWCAWIALLAQDYAGNGDWQGPT